MNLPALGAAVWAVVAAKLGLHLYAARGYGYFVDELYYLACSERLAWGYVDQPPLIAGVTRLMRELLGSSLPAIRLLPNLAGAAKVLLAALIARELGGGRFAQFFAALTVAAAPGFMAIDNWLSMNAYEPLFWMGAVLILLRLRRTGNQRLWVVLGALAGLGVLNKHSMLPFGFALIGGILLTAERNLLRGRWPWIALAAAILVAAPNIWWNIEHGFPFLELQANIRESGRNVAFNPFNFFKEEALAMHPLSLPVWLAGLWFFFRNPSGKPFRMLGYAWLFTAALIVFLNSRIYYLFPAFPLLFSAGAVQLEPWLTLPGRTWLRAGWAVLIAAVGLGIAPTVVPLLEPENYLSYSKAIHLEQPRIENRRLGRLPQLFADQFGWPELAAETARAFHSLPEDMKSSTAIFGQNYGQAGAIDLFGPALGLPKAVGGHQNYWLWGPRGYTGESILVLGGRRSELEKQFTSVEAVGRVEHPYAMPSNHMEIYHCRGLRQPLKDVWPQLKNWN